MDSVHQFGGIPIGEAEAAMRFGVADGFGGGGAMDAIAGTVEADPGDTNRIVGAGRDAQALADGGGFGIIGEQVGIKGILRVFGQTTTRRVSPSGRLLLSAAMEQGKCATSRPVVS